VWTLLLVDGDWAAGLPSASVPNQNAKPIPGIRPKADDFPLTNGRRSHRRGFGETLVAERRIKMKKFLLLGLGILVATALLTLAAAPPQAVCSTNSNCQIILSGTGLPATPTHPCTPWGMWLWSQPASNNAYGPDGDGSMYFYAIAPAEAHTEVSNISLSTNGAGQSVVSESASGTFHNGTTLSCPLIQAHETSPGHGILDRMQCTLVPPPPASSVSCSASDIPITVDISSAAK